ncbi:hypothetical protein [Prevotella sp. HMSC073D09]|uniref:hypothetical protein n=1 Tax=Prevotella sp. HMSC073D09 TaxID=1739459 RepID=UPI000AF5D1FF|nr:hypothetical protein [Prevotella sp. HMSC073D09]
MKRIYLIFIMSCLFSSISKAQTLIEQIERAYSALDSTSFIDNIVLSYSKSLEKEHEETFKSFVDICSSGVDSSDVVQKQHIADSIYLRYFKDDKTWNDQEVKKFANEVRAGTPLYVLNLKLKDKQALQVDTSRLAFNLFYFDKRCKGRLYVYCDDGEYSGLDSRYRTFSRPLGRNAPKVFRKIMRKRPKYLLFCPELEGMNTILYVINNEVFLYRIVEMEKYKLDDYMKNRTAIRDS